ncbi:MAG: sigma-54-dependent Fis family transcriptional regulator [Bacteriovoracaceae bacterium]|nr:sigma-54-dependent Fis family transcriptional regulator [Bacteriovoracaceae bacterium]
MKGLELPVKKETIFLDTRSDKMKEIYELAASVASTSSTVLITGESGTGKSFLARMIHQLSNRQGLPFVGVHCGAIPEGLAESELFGHEKGAFTGAYKSKVGRFEAANKGTIFLDEIGTISSSIQIKLLQVLQEKSFQRVGGEKDLKVDVRVIAASNIDFSSLVSQGLFREDLFYRLNVFPIEMPALRERVEDIPELVQFFVRKYSREMGKNITSVSSEAIDALKVYTWPGNIRELENVIERAFIIEKTDSLTLQSLPMSIQVLGQNVIGDLPIEVEKVQSLATVRKSALEAVERNYLQELLHQTKGKMNKSAEIAGVSPRQLHKLLTKHQIQRKDFK